MDLSVVIPAQNEAENLRLLLPHLTAVLEQTGAAHEILVVDGGSTDETEAVVKDSGASFLRQEGKGYGAALREGFEAASGEYLLVMDADLSHSPEFILKMWPQRGSAEVLVASRYVEGGVAEMPFLRRVLSLILNRFFSVGLSLDIKDLSSGFRMYRRDVIQGMKPKGKDFDILQEILILTYAGGWSIREVPFHYRPRRSGSSHARLARFAISYLKTFHRMWKLRNSIACADYDARAFNSRIPFQRWWQRSRHSILRDLAADAEGVILDLGCGSGNFICRTRSAIGLDLQLNKLRYVRRFNPRVVNGHSFHLPFKGESFGCVVCSELIEHVEPRPEIFSELRRVLRPGGTLIIGTPDYGRLSWRVTERIYGLVISSGYADEHITRYTAADLSDVLKRYGFRVVDKHYVFRSELIVKATKA